MPDTPGQLTSETGGWGPSTHAPGTNGRKRHGSGAARQSDEWKPGWAKSDVHLGSLSVYTQTFLKV